GTIGLRRRQFARVHLQRDLLLACRPDRQLVSLGLALAVRRRRRAGDPQPLPALAHFERALQDALALITDGERYLLGFAGGDVAQENTPGIEVEPRRLCPRHRQGADERGEGNVGIGLSHGLLRRPRQVHPPDRAEKLPEHAVLEKIARRRPFVLAGLG